MPLRPKNLLKNNSAETRISFWIFRISVSYLCQVEGHGGTLSKFSLKIVKIFPLQIWKIFCFLISLSSPLSHDIWILDQHPSVKTLAFLDHCVFLQFIVFSIDLIVVLNSITPLPSWKCYHSKFSPSFNAEPLSMAASCTRKGKNETCL